VAEREIVVSSESGGTLLFALLALVVVAAAVMIVASQVETLQIPVQHDHRSAVLAALADAAFAEALANLTIDSAFVGRAARPFGQGTVASQVAPSGPTTVRVTAVGAFQGWRAVIRGEVDLTDGPRVVRVERSQRPDSRTGGPESGESRALGRTQ
jgi:hypothetical protein